MDMKSVGSLGRSGDQTHLNKSVLKKDTSAKIDTTDSFSSTAKDQDIPLSLKKFKMESDMRLLKLAQGEMKDYYKGKTRRNPLKVKNSYCQHYAKINPEFAKNYGKLKAPSEIMGKLVRYGVPTLVLGGAWAAGALTGGLALGLFGVITAVNLGEDFLATR